MNIRVLIVDDKASIRDALTMLFKSTNDVEVIQLLPHAIGVEDIVKTSKPDIILMDIDMPGINGIQAVKKIRAAQSNVPVIMLTVFEDEDRIFDAIKAGANGYLLKNTKPYKIVEAIRDVYNGGASFTPAIAKKVLGFFQVPKKKHDPYHLTKREKEVLSHLIKGQPYKIISAEMNISYETVRSHMKHIYAKIHVSSLTEAVVKTLKEGLLD